MTVGAVVVRLAARRRRVAIDVLRLAGEAPAPPLDAGVALGAVAVFARVGAPPVAGTRTPNVSQASPFWWKPLSVWCTDVSRGVTE
jgi:hypothetical protein